MSDAVTPRHIPNRQTAPWALAAKSWETLLFALLLAICITASLSTPFFLDPWSLSDATFNFTEKGIVALAMAFLMIAGEIDLSVSSTMALASTLMGAAAQYGAPTELLVLIGLGVGLVCGLANALLVVRFGLPSIIVTIGTMSLYRGISYIILGDTAYKGYPASFAWFGQGYVWWVFSFEFVLFLGLSLVAGGILHGSIFGRVVRTIGLNALAARFSGVQVDRVRFALFMATGLAAGIASILLTSRLGSTRPSIAVGWELEVVTMVVLGGVDINGGHGSIVGVVIAAFIMGLVTFGLGLFNVPGIVMSIIFGVMLISVIALPILARRLFSKGRRA